VVHIAIISFIFFLAVSSVLRVFTVHPGKVTKLLLEDLQQKFHIEKQLVPKPLEIADNMNKVIARHMAGVQRLPYSVASSAKMGKFTKILKNKMTKSNKPSNMSYNDDIEYASNGS